MSAGLLMMGAGIVLCAAGLSFMVWIAVTAKSAKKKVMDKMEENY